MAPPVCITHSTALMPSMDLSSELPPWFGHLWLCLVVGQPLPLPAFFAGPISEFGWGASSPLTLRVPWLLWPSILVICSSFALAFSFSSFGCFRVGHLGARFSPPSFLWLVWGLWWLFGPPSLLDFQKKYPH